MSLAGNNFKLTSLVLGTYYQGNNSGTFICNGQTVTDVSSNVDYTVVKCTGNMTSGSPYLVLPSRASNYVFVKNNVGVSLQVGISASDSNFQTVTNTEYACLFCDGVQYNKVALSAVTLDIGSYSSTSSLTDASLFLVKLIDGSHHSLTLGSLKTLLGINAVTILNAKVCTSPTNIAPITLAGVRTINAISCSSGDIVLVNGQDSAIQNGLYTMATGSWTRATQMAAGSSASPALVAVHTGSYAALYVCNTAAGSDIVGSNNIYFNPISGIFDGTTITGSSGVYSVAKLVPNNLLASDEYTTFVTSSGNTTHLNTNSVMVSNPAPNSGWVSGNIWTQAPTVLQNNSLSDHMIGGSNLFLGVVNGAVSGSTTFNYAKTFNQTSGVDVNVAGFQKLYPHSYVDTAVVYGDDVNTLYRSTTNPSQILSSSNPCGNATVVESRLQVSGSLNSSGAGGGVVLSEPIMHAHTHTQVRIASGSTSVVLTPFQVNPSWNVYMGTMRMSRIALSGAAINYIASATVPFVASLQSGSGIFYIGSSDSSTIIPCEKASYTNNAVASVNCPTNILSGLSCAMSSSTGLKGSNTPVITMTVPAAAVQTTLDIWWEYSMIHTL